MRDRILIALALLLGGGSIVLLAAGGSDAFTDFGWSERDLLLWDAFLSFVFFVQHSGMVRKPFRAWLARSITQDYHGALYSIASGITLVLVVIFWQRSDVTLWSAQAIMRVLLPGCGVLALALFVWSALSVQSFDILGIAPLRARLRGTSFEHGPFEVRGPYRWMRHPLYTGVLLVLWANPVMTTDRLLFSVLWSAWVIGATFLEERDLVREFGAQYAEYQQHVPMLIPIRRPWPPMPDR